MKHTKRHEPDAASGRRILVVADSKINRLVATRLLNRLQYRHVDQASDGGQALEMLSRTPYELVFMDLELDEKSGLETACGIRAGLAGDSAAEVPIIAMTNHTPSDARKECIEAGMNGFLQKPLSLEPLQAALDNSLGLATHAGTPDEAPADDTDLALLDRQSAVSRMAGDEDVYDKVLAMFMKEHPASMRLAREALDSGNFGKVKDVAHSMKTMYRSVGAMSCGGLSDSLEAAALSKDIAETSRVFATLEQEVGRLMPLLSD